MIKIVEDGSTLADAIDIKTLGLKAHSYSISAPEMQTNYIEIPGRDGALDLTEALGKQTYRNRRVKFSGIFTGNAGRWHYTISEILNRFNGKYLKAIFGNDPNYYWAGRVSISHERLEEEVYGVTFIMEAEPYKVGLYASDEEWRWDPFNFDTGVIRGYKDIQISGETGITVVAYDRPITPVIMASTAMTLEVRKNGTALWDEYSLEAGQNIIEDLEIESVDPKEDFYTFRFTGTGEVTIVMREVSL